MSSDIYSKPSPAACLSEEAMDLICSFVREIEDDSEMAKTLCALSLASRRWTSSAVRALYFDPTRSLSRVTPVRACWALSARLIKQPGLGAYVRELQRLPTKHDFLYEGQNEAKVETWVLTLLKACPRLLSIAIPAGSSMDWATELGGLRFLRNLTIAPISLYEEGLEVDELSFFLERYQVSALKVHTLTLRNVVSYDWASLAPSEVEIQVDCLELIDYNLQTHVDFPIRATGLKHLRLQPSHFSLTQGSKLLVPSLEKLEFLPLEPHPPPPNRLNDYDKLAVHHLSFPFHSFPVLPHLRHLSLEFTLIPLPIFAQLAKRCPQLDTLELEDSLVFADEVRGSVPSSVVEVFETALEAMPRLTVLNLGWLPVYPHDPVLPLRHICTRRGVDLVFKPALVLTFRRKERPSLQYSRRGWLDSDLDSDEYDLSDASDYDGLSTSFVRSRFSPPAPTGTYTPPASPVDSYAQYNWQYEAFRAYRAAEEDRENDEDEHEEEAHPDDDYLFSLAFPNLPALYSLPSPSSSRSSSPDFESLACDRQLEPHYQFFNREEADEAGDLGEADQDDFDGGEDEAWRDWEELDEVEEAERAWREGEGTTYAPIEEERLDEVEEEDAASELDERDVEAAIEEWRPVEEDRDWDGVEEYVRVA
ncbi:hypothetical protein JCM8097_008761 [Rhodosporidiobolus ruineniae]